MRLLGQVDNRWVFVGGRHTGQSLEKIASQTPEYLVALLKHKATYNISDAEYWAIEEIMEKYGILFPE